MKKSILTSFWSFIILSHAFATQETALLVSQPMFTENGIVESVCTYSVFVNYSLTKKMALSCAENCILSNNSHSNRNLANLFGFNIEFSRKWEDMYINFKDTMKVDLVIPTKFDLTNKILNEITIDQIVRATIISLFNNATSYKFINYLDLKILFNSEYEKYSNTYSKNNIFSYDDF